MPLWTLSEGSEPVSLTPLLSTAYLALPMTGIVLIGGQSTRFGADKMVARLGPTVLIERVVETLAPLFPELILIGHRRKGLEGYRVVEDLVPGSGPLGGIYTALSVVNTPRCFVVAGDMPNLSQALIRHMMGVEGDHDALVPTWSRGKEPLHAIYQRRVMPEVESMLQRGRLRTLDLLENVDTVLVPEEVIRAYGDPEVVFANVNTQQDLGGIWT
jgi:molybdopterin-guanine dinucleotide biosynthesis protein A